MSSKVLWHTVPSFHITNSAPVSASAANDMTCFKIPDIVSTTPLQVCTILPSVGSPLIKKFTDTLLLAWVSLRYDTSMCPCRVIFLRLYLNFASSCAAEKSKNMCISAATFLVALLCLDANRHTVVPPTLMGTLHDCNIQIII